MLPGHVFGPRGAVGTTTLAMPPDILVGLPVTSHNDGTLATADFDDVSVTR